VITIARAGWVLVLSLFALAPSARAQDLNYQRFLIGDRALGMGGAFTGLADDASAAWYNPAGLAQLPSSSLSGSLSIDAFNEYVVEDGYGALGQTADLEHDAQPSLPLFASLVRKFGPRDDERFRRHAIALSTIHPTRVQRSFDATVRGFDPVDPAVPIDATLIMSESDKVSWWGPSYAYRVSPAFALGVSAFLVTRDFRHEEDEVVVTEGMRDPSSGLYSNSTLSVRQSIVEIDALSTVFRLGATWDPAPHWRVGVMVQPPGIQVAGSSRVYDRRSFADLIGVPATATFFLSDQKDLDSESPIPWEVRVGGSYRHDDDSAIALDVSLYGAVGSEDDLVQAVGDGEPDPVTAETPQEGDYVVSDYYSRITANASLGFETTIADVVPFRAGVFTDFSAAPPIDGPSGIYAPAHVDSYGASLSVGLSSGGYDLAIGAAGSIGSGTGYRRNPDPGGATPEPDVVLLPDGPQERRVAPRPRGVRRVHPPRRRPAAPRSGGAGARAARAAPSGMRGSAAPGARARDGRAASRRRRRGPRAGARRRRARGGRRRGR
jgi:long-chain fatty acid transport protein